MRGAEGWSRGVVKLEGRQASVGQRFSSVAAARTPSQLLPLPPRSGWLLPPTVTGLPLSFVHTKSVFAHMRVALSAVVRLSTCATGGPWDGWSRRRAGWGLVSLAARRTAPSHRSTGGVTRVSPASMALHVARRSQERTNRFVDEADHPAEGVPLDVVGERASVRRDKAPRRLQRGVGVVQREVHEERPTRVGACVLVHDAHRLRGEEGARVRPVLAGRAESGVAAAGALGADRRGERLVLRVAPAVLGDEEAPGLGSGSRKRSCPRSSSGSSW